MRGLGRSPLCVVVSSLMGGCGLACECISLILGGDVLELEVLRPAKWFGEVGPTVGGLVGVELGELNVAGSAMVVSLGPPPPLRAGSRCPVTGRVRDLSYDVIGVVLADGEMLEVTRHHRLFSADRGHWVAAGDLRVGERLRSLSGVVGVEENRGPAEAESGREVFNLEVHAEHWYFVGDAGVVAHNQYADAKAGRNHLQDIFSIKRQKGLGDIAPGTRADADALGSARVNGPNVKRFDLGDVGYGLTDGTRTSRLQFKPKDGVWKANFQENTFIPGRTTGVEVKSIHMTITDMVAP